jgi:hypothetical protein
VQLGMCAENILNRCGGGVEHPINKVGRLVPVSDRGLWEAGTVFGSLSCNQLRPTSEHLRRESQRSTNDGDRRVCVLSPGGPTLLLVQMIGVAG